MEIIDLDMEEALTLYGNPNGRIWTPVGTGSGVNDPMLHYFTGITYAIIEVIATKEKQHPPIAYRQKGKSFTEISDGLLGRMQRRPNSSRQTFGKLLGDRRRMEEIWGRAFIYLDPSERLWLMPYNQNDKATYSPSNQLDITQYNINGKPYDPKVIIPFVTHNPANSYRIENPVSPLKAALKSVFLSDKYFQFVARAFANGCNPPGVLQETQAGIGNDDKRKTDATDVKTQMTDANDGTPVVIPFGYEWKQLQIQYKDLIGNAETAKQIRVEACACFRFPNGLTDSTAPTRQALDAMLEQLYDLCIIPRLEERDEILTHFFREYCNDDSIVFMTPDPRPVDADKMRADWQMFMSTGAVKKNELRKQYAFYGLEELPEFDETATKPAPQAPVPFEDATIDGVVDTAPVPTTTGGSAPQEEPKDKINMYQMVALQKEVYAGTIARDAAIGQLTVLFGFSPEEANKLIPEQTKTLTTVVAPDPEQAPVPEPKSKAKKTASRDDLETILANFFRKQRDHVLSKLTGNEKAVKGKAFVKGKESYWWGFKADTDDVEPFFSVKEANRQLFDDVYPVMSIWYERAAEQHLIKLGVEGDMFGVYSHKLKSAIKNRILHFCNETNKTTLLSINDAYARVKDTVEEGLTEGQRLEDIRKAVGEIYENAESNRCYAISNTESKIASTQAEHMASIEAGVTGMRNQGSDNMCPVCDGIAKKAGDKYYPMDHKFGGSEYSNFLPPYHPLCKCSLLYQIQEADE